MSNSKTLVRVIFLSHKFPASSKKCVESFLLDCESFLGQESLRVEPSLMVTAPLAPPEMVNATTRMRTADVEFETRSPVLRAVPISTLSREIEFESQPAHSFVVAAAIYPLIFVSQVQRKDNNNDNDKKNISCKKDLIFNAKV